VQTERVKLCELGDALKGDDRANWEAVIEPFGINS